MALSELALRILERVHGHLGWLATLALIHPALLLRQPRRSLVWVAGLATLLITAVGGLGIALYPSYRVAIKPLIYATAPAVGDLFERKEHLAVAAVVLAWVGWIGHWAEQGPEGAPRSAVARSAYSCASLLAILVGVLGVIVAVKRSF